MQQRTVLMAHPGTELYGSDRMFCESVRALQAAACDVVVTLPGSGPILGPLREIGVPIVICPTPILRKAAFRPKGFARLLGSAGASVFPAVRLIRTVRPDAIYVNTVIAPGWAAVAVLARRPLIVHVHEAEAALPKLAQTGLALPLLAADLVLVNSRATATTVGRSLPRLRSRFRLLYNGVPGLPSPPSPPPAPARPARLVVVGRLSPRKGTDLAVEATALLRDRGRSVSLRLVGSVFSGYEWYEEQLRRQVAGNGLDDSVMFAGFCESVWPVYTDADIALVPSYGESLGNTAIEAQLARVPVIVSDAQGLPETVDQGHTGTIVPTGDPGALADAIEGLLDDWTFARERADLAAHVAAERFSPKRYADDLVRAVREVT